MAVIRLIGVPAPPAELTGAYIPFHNAAGARFILSQPLHQSPREETYHRHTRPARYRFCAPTPGLPSPLQQGCASAEWMEFPQDPSVGPVTAHRLTAKPTSVPVHERCATCFNQYRSEREPHRGPTPWAIGGCGLNVSAEALTRTPQLHQPHLLWEPSSSHREPSPALESDWNGCLFSGGVSGLDAFSPYPR